MKIDMGLLRLMLVKSRRPSSANVILHHRGTKKGRKVTRNDVTQGAAAEKEVFCSLGL